MCGLIACINQDTKYNNRLDDWFRDALIASQLRGQHSTGMFQVMQNPHFSMFKQAVNATDFVELGEASRMINLAPKAQLTVGHVRHATVGEKTVANAHPFVHLRDDKTKVIGVHNGTLKGWRSKKGSDKMDVDSAWAIKMLGEEGPVDAFEHIDGAFAMIWYDSRYPDHVFLTRNSERPLHYYISPDGKTMLVGSELGMLGWTAARNGYGINTDKNKPNLFYLKTDKIYKFSLKNVGQYETLDRPSHDPSTDVVVPANKAPVVSNVGGQPHYGYNHRTNRYEYGRGYSSVYGEDRDWGTSAYGSKSYRQDIVLSEVKEALADARNKLDDEHTVPENPDVVSSDELDERLASGIRKSIESFHTKKGLDPWTLLRDPRYLANPNAAKATSAEIKAARDKGSYGFVVCFTGITHDEETGDLWGTAYMLNRTEDKVYDNDCIMRGIPRGLAKSRYVDRNEYYPAVVIGESKEGIMKGEITYIIEELTPEEAAAVRTEIEKKSDKHTIH